MKYKAIVDEDFNNYKKPAMFIGAYSCSGKCWKELHLSSSVCQNDVLNNSETLFIDNDNLISKYINNHITSAIVFGGLEPFDQFTEIYDFIKKLREDYRCRDDVVIYTGYYPDEIETEILMLERYPNIIVKFGRYIPNIESRYDEILGVNLASDNQYAQVLKW